MAVSCMFNEKYQYNRYLMVESPRFPLLVINDSHPSIDRSPMKLLLFHPTEQFGQNGHGYGADNMVHRMYF